MLDPASLKPVARRRSLPRRQARRKLGRLAVVSLLLHALLLGLILLWLDRRPPPAETALPSTVAMMFEPKAGRRSTPEPSPVEAPAAPSQAQNAPPLPVPAPVEPAPAPPVPQPPPPEPPAPEPPAPQPPTPQPPTTQPTTPEPPAPAPAPEPPAPAPLPPAPAPPPVLPAPAPPPAAELPPPLPVPPPEPAKPPPKPAPVAKSPPRPAPPREAPPHRQASTAFPAPMMGLSFGSGLGSFHSAPQKPQPGPAAVGVQSFGDFAKVTQGHVEGSWMSLLHNWWEHHAYYPDQAAALGQDGTVEIEIVVDKFGNVKGLRLLDRSGSQWLDMGAESVFRDARLPSLMPFTSDDQITVDLSIHYLLLRP